MPSILVLVLSLAFALGVGAIGARTTARAVPAWYAGLQKPFWSPPNSVFAPVWTTLYVLMAIAAWLVWQVGGLNWTMGIYSVQLVLNAGWTYIFFGCRRPGWALAEISLLWVSILLTMLAFFSYSTLAGALLIPYLVWVTFASSLNWGVWMLNPRTPETRPMR